MPDRLLVHIEAQLDELIQRHQDLEAKHHELREKEQTWMDERACLERKHELARARIESMITRLKQIEANA